MALANFIPTIWSAQLLISLKKSLVYAAEGIINRDYQGEITAYGDTVKINMVGAITVGDYNRNTNIGDPETLTDSSRTLLIDQSKYFNFQVDDLDKAQQNPKVMQQAMVEAAYALRNTADQFVAAKYVDADPSTAIGSDGTPYAFTGVTDAYEQLVNLSVKLDEANIPEEGRWVIIPPFMEGMMLKDNRFVQYTPTQDNTRTNGRIGRAAGFEILKSNNVPNTAGTKYKIIAGTSGAWSYAEQINQLEAYRPQQRFADAVKGLHLYGGKVVRPTNLAVLTANRPAGS